MSVIEIKDRDDLRVGDVATFAVEDDDGVMHAFSGEAWSYSKGGISVGANYVRYRNGVWAPGFHFVRATRVVPDLPTEPGSVIYVSRLINAEPYTDPRPMLLMANGQWVTTNPGARGEHLWLIDKQIAEWTPAKVVPA